jgi:ATP-dependent RNA helicase DeaD
MEQFHSKKTQVLVCTDIAARGLDIKGVSHIYNYNIPNDAKEYIHRIGRTARAGKEGKVINLISTRDHENYRSVLREDSLKIDQLPTPEIERIPIRWVPEGRRGRPGRDSGGRGNFRGNRDMGERGDDRRYSAPRRDRGIGRTSSFGSRTREGEYRQREDSDRREYSRGPRGRPTTRDSRHRSPSHNRDSKRPSSNRRRF